MVSCPGRGGRLLRALAPALVAAALMTRATAARAGDPDSETVEAARTDFGEGTAHFQAKRWAEAHKAFERSHALVASPNTELMIARCLRELGRRGDAAEKYASAAVEARARVARGEGKYGQTADAATNEGNAVRAGLGTIRIHVERPAGVALLVDRKSVALSKDGAATVLHEPGTASVSVIDANGAEQRQSATVVAGAAVQMDFAPQTAPPKPDPVPVARPEPPVPAPPVEHRAGWAWPAAIVSGAVSVVGLGTFIGFGASSQSTYDDLRARCRFGCGPADRDDADSGKHQQTIANVALGLSVTAAVATAVFVVIALTDRSAAYARLFDRRRGSL